MFIETWSAELTGRSESYWAWRSDVYLGLFVLPSHRWFAYTIILVSSFLTRVYSGEKKNFPESQKYSSLLYGPFVWSCFTSSPTKRFQFFQWSSITREHVNILRSVGFMLEIVKLDHCLFSRLRWISGIIKNNLSPTIQRQWSGSLLSNNTCPVPLYRDTMEISFFWSLGSPKSATFSKLICFGSVIYLFLFFTSWYLPAYFRNFLRFPYYLWDSCLSLPVTPATMDTARILLLDFGGFVGHCGRKLAILSTLIFLFRWF